VLATINEEVRYALRALRRTPAFTLTAVLTLTFAIGASTAIFSVLNGLMLRRLSVPNPEQLVQVSTVFRSGQEAALSVPMFRELANRQDVFSAVIGWWSSIASVETDGSLAQVSVVGVSGNYYSELGAMPTIGRSLLPADVNLDTFSGAPVAVLGHAFWQRRFGGDPAVIGSVMRVQGAPFTVVGVAPRGFKGFGLVAEPDVTVPLTAHGSIFRGFNFNPASAGLLWMKMAARLRPGVTLDQGRAQLEAVWPAIKSDIIPPTHAGAQRDNFLAIRLNVQSLATGQEDLLRSRFTRPLYFLLGISLVVLLIACVNLAMLMLRRVTERVHDLALRTALGAGRWRAASPIVTEGVLVSLAGGFVGIWLAYAASKAIAGMIVPSAWVSVSLDTTPDLRVLAWTTATAIAAGLLSAFVPAWVGARRDLRYLLRQHAGTTSGSARLGTLLIAGQVALCVALLTNAGLIVRSWQHVLAVDTGFSTGEVAIADFIRRPEIDTRPDLDVYYAALVDRAEAVPGVERASIAQIGIASGRGFTQPVSPMAAEPASGVPAAFNAVSPGFFGSLDIPIVEGRDFAWSDRAAGPRAVIISRALARRLFPQGGAVGQRIRIGTQPYRQDLEVVGVTADVRLHDLKDPLSFSVYIAALQNSEPMDGGHLIIRGQAFSEADLQEAVQSSGPDYVVRLQPVPEIIDAALVQEKTTAAFAGFFGAVALVLAAMGIGGLVAYAVAQRTKEIAIRLALGAERRRIVKSVLKRGMVVAFVGTAVGLLVGIVSAQSLRALFFGVGPHDPIVLLGVPSLLFLVAVAACVIPAYRAASIEPTLGLRTE
jgi:predicted permease